MSVGRYQVNITSFEETALPTLQLPSVEEEEKAEEEEKEEEEEEKKEEEGGGILMWEEEEEGGGKNGGSRERADIKGEKKMMGRRRSVRQVMVIDEVGKMELFSQSFSDIVNRLFQRRDIVLLATIPVARQRSPWLVEKLRSNPDCILFEVLYVCLSNTENG